MHLFLCLLEICAYNKSEMLLSVRVSINLKDFRSTVALTFATSKLLNLRHCPSCPCTDIQGGANYVSMDFHPRLEQPPMVKFYARVSSRVLFLYLINKQQNLAFLSGRLTSSSDLPYQNRIRKGMHFWQLCS